MSLASLATICYDSASIRAIFLISSKIYAIELNTLSTLGSPVICTIVTFWNILMRANSFFYYGLKFIDSSSSSDLLGQ
jgi:hypothetical protein